MISLRLMADFVVLLSFVKIFIFYLLLIGSVPNILPALIFPVACWRRPGTFFIASLYYSNIFDIFSSLHSFARRSLILSPAAAARNFIAKYRINRLAFAGYANWWNTNSVAKLFIHTIYLSWRKLLPPYHNNTNFVFILITSPKFESKYCPIRTSGR